MRYSLHKVNKEDSQSFSPSDYSKFKYGDKLTAKQFGTDLFYGFVKVYGDYLLKSKKDILIIPSPYLSIPTASSYLSWYFKKELDLFLFKNNKQASIESKIYRKQTYTVDYGNLSFKERKKLISNDTYYIDSEFLKNKVCLFLDDIKITGSHEETIKEILINSYVKGEHIYIYFAELINRKINPKIENFFNYSYVKDDQKLINFICEHEFSFTTRMIKHILKMEKKSLMQLLAVLDESKLDSLFQFSISNNYHLIDEYSENLNSIKNYQKKIT